MNDVAGDTCAGPLRTTSVLSSRYIILRRVNGADRRTSRSADYPIRILQFAEIVGRTENRRPSAVLADRSLAAVDLIRVRLPRTYDDHSLKLNTGVDLLPGSRKLDSQRIAGPVSSGRKLHV